MQILSTLEVLGGMVKYLCLSLTSKGPEVQALLRPPIFIILQRLFSFKRACFIATLFLRFGKYFLGENIKLLPCSLSFQLYLL